MSSYAYSESANAAEGDCRPLPDTTCFACGHLNPYGLQICYQIVETGQVRAEWRPEGRFTGFDGVVHSGIVATALDEAMAKAIVATDTQALTGEIRVRFHHPVHPGDDLAIRGWVVEQKQRLVKTEACVCDVCGEELAHAWAVFLLDNGVGPHHGR